MFMAGEHRDAISCIEDLSTKDPMNSIYSVVLVRTTSHHMPHTPTYISSRHIYFSSSETRTWKVVITKMQ